MAKFKFKEIDEEGEDTLKSVGEAKLFNKWMFSEVEPFNQGKIFEIGSGVGNISEFFLDGGYDITLSDIRENYCGYLEDKFSKYSNLSAIVKMDAERPDFDEAYKEHIGKYDSVFSLNVVEHIADDQLAVVNATKLLKRGGQLTILVPAYQTLFNSIDKGLDHYRRYTKKSLTSLLRGADLQIEHKQYFNFMGIPGWFAAGMVTRQRTVGGGQMKLYNLGVPVFKVLDKMLMKRVGLSVIAVGKKI
ncbi:MAG TPA: methyltransferase [Cryomorphaceae bacterium]|nr:methyltransferase [Cryomorphaceae bacterium]